MDRRTTPLGFLPVDVDRHIHCMYVYGHQDDTYARNISDYISAGIGAGELCICTVSGAAKDRITEHMTRKGVDVASCLRSGQLFYPDGTTLYTRDGRLDFEGMQIFWQCRLDEMRRKWNGIRVFGDPEPLGWTRLMYLKFLEYESMVNAVPRSGPVLCGYRSKTGPRSFVSQARKAHPFVAGSNNISANPAYMNPEKFLAALYRFRCMRRAYSAVRGRVDDLRRDIETIAARTPLTMFEIDHVKIAAGEAFLQAVDDGRDEPSLVERRINATITTESDKMLVTLRCRRQFGNYGYSRESDAGNPFSGIVYLARGFVDDVYIGSAHEDVLITMVKKYSVTIPE